MENFESLIIDKNATLKDSLTKMDTIGKKLLIVLEGDIFQGLISIGDIQRAILQEISLDIKVKTILREDYVVASVDTPTEEIKDLMLSIRAEFMPVLSNDGIVEKVILWNEIFGLEEEPPVEEFNIPIVVMAGGYGSRLKPITNVLPKALIPISDKSMLEEIFSRFSRHGSNRFHISVNYKADLIQYYLESQNLPYDLSFFKEEKPLGTAGSLHLLKGKLNETFFVSNCDILVEQDYSEVLKYHQENNNEITLVAALKNIEIPYGTLTTGENGILTEMTEKPNYSLKINSGLYILEPHLIKEVPENEFFHITHLIQKIIDRKGKVGVFPISEKSWKDIGEWDTYLQNKEG